MTKYTDIYLLEYSVVCEDGTRNLLNKELLARCPLVGTANLIAKYLRENAYKYLLAYDGETSHIFKIVVE